MKKTGKVKGKSQRVVISCLVSPGMFSTERQVVITMPDGHQIEALVDHRSVVLKGTPKPGESANGYVTVSVVEYDKHTKHALVDLPQGSFSKGPRIRVPSNMVQAA
jgi:hypothetical protein